MAALDLLGRRWSLRVLWELRGAPLTFRALRDACGGPSPTVLNRRLTELRDARLVDHEEPGGYRLSDVGTELLEALTPLTEWSRRWAEQGRR
jgi:DNA-binding HxlR family transcriptional regulator